MLTLDECVKAAPITIIYIGTEEELLAKFEDTVETHDYDTVNIEFAQTGRRALSMALKIPNPKVVYGLIAYMKQNEWSIAEKLHLLSAFAIAKLDLADDISDEQLPHLEEAT